jgi:site-specific DNA-methyltransferase (adenine-specific)
MATKFFRFFVLLKKNTQNAAKGVYSFVPMQDFSEPWSDEKLYKKYNLTNDEITFIESMIRPMELNDE